MQSLRLKEMRSRSGITQELLAEYLGVNQSMVARLEKGTRKLTVAMVEKICWLFGCTEAYLLGNDDSGRPLGLKFALDTRCLTSKDLEAVANVNRIVANLAYMNEMMAGENEKEFI